MNLVTPNAKTSQRKAERIRRKHLSEVRARVRGIRTQNLTNRRRKGSPTNVYHEKPDEEFLPFVSPSAPRSFKNPKLNAGIEERIENRLIHRKHERRAGLEMNRLLQKFDPPPPLSPMIESKKDSVIDILF